MGRSSRLIGMLGLSIEVVDRVLNRVLKEWRLFFLCWNFEGWVMATYTHIPG